jgi:LuxR family quorum sensing-dependent transcriptional regulator
MSRHSLDLTLTFIRRLDRCRSPAEVCAALLGIAGQYGAEHVLAGTIPVPGTGRRQQRDHVILDFWPAEWSERYFSQGYLFRDPTIRRIATSTDSFSWGDVEPLCRDDPAARRIMAEAGEFHLNSGFTVPLLTVEGAAAGFSLAGRRLEIGPNERGMLTLLATYALGRAILIRGAVGAEEAPLSPRERVALQWVAEGKTDWETAQLMGISQHGVDRHMRVARQKLGAASRTHAVAEAIRRGIIT